MIKESDYIVAKGTNSNIDSYSGFWDNAKLSKTELHDILMKNKVTDVYICGLAFDVCVGSTALHAVELGYRTLVIRDACKGVAKESIAEMEKTLQEVGVILVNSSQVMNLVKAKDRRPNMVIKTIENMQKARKLEKTNFVMQQKIVFGTNKRKTKNGQKQKGQNKKSKVAVN